MVCTFLRRAETVVSDLLDMEEEVKHAKKALTANGSTKLVFEIIKKKEKAKDPFKDRATARKFPVSIPYISGVLEQLQGVVRSHGVPSYHKLF